MASLNTLRTKFGVVLSVIIALALLAFIFSLKTEMGFSGNDPKVGVFDGDKVSYSEYLEEYESVKAQSGAQENDEQQVAMLSNAAWQAILAKHIIVPGFEKMGIVLTEPERVSLMNGERQSQAFYSAFADPRTGAYNVQAVGEFLTQAATNPQAQQAWASINQQAKMEREVGKFLGLVKGGAYVNSLEIADGVKAANKTYAGSWTVKRYADIADSLFTVSKSDIKGYYNSHKGQFKQTPSRKISYALFEVMPTADDILAIEKEAKSVGAEFAVAEDVNAFARKNHNGTIADTYVSSSQLSADEAQALMSGAMYGPVEKNDAWVMSRVVASKMAPDTLGIKHIVLSYTDDKLADSLVVALKAGADFAAAAAQYSVYDATAQNGGEVGLMPYSAFNGDFADALANVKAGDVVKIASGDAIQIMKIYRADAPKKHVKVATITYPVEASQATRRDIHNQAGVFSVEAKGSADKFNEAATNAKVNPRVASIARGERVVNGIEDSREVARWAYGAEVGDISEIFNVGKDYVVAVLTNIDDDDYASIESATPQIKAAVLRDMKFDYIAKDVKGKSIDQAAVAFGSTVEPFEGVNFSSFYINGLGVEPRVVGAVTATAQGAVSAPVKGGSGVYVVSVSSIAEEPKQTPEAEKVRAQAMAEGMAQQGAFAAIQQMSKIQDLRGKYF